MDNVSPSKLVYLVPHSQDLTSRNSDLPKSVNVSYFTGIPGRKRKENWRAINEGKKETLGLRERNWIPLRVSRMGNWNGYVMWTPTHRVRLLWLQGRNSQRLQKSYGEKGMAWPLSEWERGPQPLPEQVFIAFLGTLHCGWSSFIMHKFAVGDDLLQITKERMLLITSKRRVLQLRGKSGWTGYTPFLGGFAQILGSYFKDMQ